MLLRKGKHYGVGISLAAGENPREGYCSEVGDLGVEFEGEVFSSLGFFDSTTSVDSTTVSAIVSLVSTLLCLHYSPIKVRAASWCLVGLEAGTSSSFLFSVTSFFSSSTNFFSFSNSYCLSKSLG